jgi:hypothetical protein
MGEKWIRQEQIDAKNKPVFSFILFSCFCTLSVLEVRGWGIWL